MTTTTTRNLKPYEQENRWLEQPQALCTYYIRDKVICASPAGYYMYSLPPADREFFRFGHPEDIANLDDASDFCTLHRESVSKLEQLSATLQPTGLVAVALHKEGYILSSLDGSRHFAVCEDDIERLTSAAVAALLQMPECGLNHPHCISRSE